MKPLNPKQENEVAGGSYVQELVDIEQWPPYQIEPHRPLQPDDVQPAELDPEPTIR